MPQVRVLRSSAFYTNFEEKLIGVHWTELGQVMRGGRVTEEPIMPGATGEPLEAEIGSQRRGPLLSSERGITESGWP